MTADDRPEFPEMIRRFGDTIEERKAALAAELDGLEEGLYMVADPSLAIWERRVFRHFGRDHWHEVGGGYIEPAALRRYRLVLLIPASEGDL